MRALKPRSARWQVAHKQVDDSAEMDVRSIVFQMVREVSVQRDAVDARLKEVVVVKHRLLDGVDIVRRQAVAFVIGDVPASVFLEQKVDEALKKSGEPIKPPLCNGFSPRASEIASFGDERVLEERLREGTRGKLFGWQVKLDFGHCRGPNLTQPHAMIAEEDFRFRDGLECVFPRFRGRK